MSWDILRFRNNQELLLQHLAEGQRVVVLSLACAEDRLPAEGHLVEET
jgi:hypothetical protein